MAMRRALARIGAPLSRERAAHPALARARGWFASDAAAGTAGEASSSSSSTSDAGVRSRGVSFVEPDGDAPPPPRRVAHSATRAGSAGGAEAAAPTLTIEEAVAGVKAGARAKFTETVDIAVRLGIDPKRSDMIVRGAANLPHGTGKSVRVCVFAEGALAEEARAAGADVIGDAELIARIKAEGSGAIDFDKAVAHPSAMPKLAPIARVLGPRGMMPNPKVGTLTTDIAGAVGAMKAGRVEFRAEKGAVVHARVGKTDFDDAQLAENVKHFMAVIMDLRPRGVKGAPSVSNYLKGASLSSTMGRGSHRIAKEALVKGAAEAAAAKSA
jgi:large subunit ribosomal protein L1